MPNLFDFQTSFREEHAYPAISKLFDNLVGCEKCRKGVIPDNKISESNLIYGTSKVCSCYKNYETIKKYVISGIEREYWKIGDLHIDPESKGQINHYLSRLDKVFKKGIGILFTGNPEGLERPNSGVGKTISAVKILQEAIKAGRTAHYITMQRYFELTYRSKGENGTDFYRDLVDEIDSVDFLCIDEVGKKVKTEFSYNRFEDLIRNRTSQFLVTILITNMNEAELEAFVGHSIMDIIKHNMIKLCLVGNSFRKKKFLDMKKELED